MAVSRSKHSQETAMFLFERTGCTQEAFDEDYETYLDDVRYGILHIDCDVQVGICSMQVT